MNSQLPSTLNAQHSTLISLSPSLEHPTAQCLWGPRSRGSGESSVPLYEGVGGVWVVGVLFLAVFLFSSCRTQVVERSHSRDVSVAVASSDSLSSRVSDSRRLSDVRRYYTEYVYDSVSVIPAPASQLQNCTQPSTLNPQLLSTLNSQPKTTYHYRERLRARTDTVFLSDTVCIHDTLFVRSASSRMDTVIHTDTIYLTRPAEFSRTTPEPTFGMSPRTCVGRFFARLGSALVVFLRALEACLACVGAVRIVRLAIRLFAC